MASNQDVYVRLLATDGITPVFQKIGTTAQLTGNQMSQSAQKASRDWNDAGRKIGLAIGATTALAIRANNQSEASQARLKASIEATGKSYDQYSEAIKRAQKAAMDKAFDDEDAADAIATLTQATGDAEKAIKDLSLAEDVARARKIDLAAAANIVAAAEQGRYGILARMGIQISDNATREQALAEIQQKTAGQAQAYAETNAAAWDRIQIKAENALESIGAKLEDHQALILSVSAAWTAFGGAVSSVAKLTGLSGAQAGGVGAAGAGFAIDAALIYSLITSRGQGGSNLADTVFGGAAGALNRIPGASSVGQFFGFPSLGSLANIPAYNNVQDAAMAYFNFTPGANGKVSDEAIAARLAVLFGITGTSGSNEVFSRIRQMSSYQGLGYGQLIQSQLSDSPYIFDSVSGKYFTPGDYNRAIAARQGAESQRALAAYPAGSTIPSARGMSATSAALTGNAGVAPSSGRVAAAAGNYPMASEMGTGIVQQTAALKEQYGAYYTLADGVITASDALGAFKTAQDGTIASEGKYSGQLGEYNSQLSALSAAYDEVNAKKESGAELTERETKFLDGYSAANERLTGGVYDSTLALGLQAEQYASNMSAADEFKSATGDMTTAVYDLINALAGIPGYVQTAVNVDVNDGGAYNLGAYLSWLNGQEFRTRWVNETVNITTGQVAGPSVDAMANGGTVPYAAHGLTSSGTYATVGEYGPEMVWLPGGAQVTNAVATQSRRAREGVRGGDIHYHINGGIHVSANTPDEFATALGHVRR